MSSTVCTGCGAKLGYYRDYFASELVRRKHERDEKPLSAKTVDKGVAGVILDELHIAMPCCRTAMLTDVDINKRH